MSFKMFDIFKSKKYTPTKGEIYVCKLLDEYLPEYFEIYIQPSLGGPRPDIVLLSQKYGAFIVEVKDWMLERYYKERRTRYISTKDGRQREYYYDVFIWTGDDGKSYREIENPSHQVQHYHKLLAKLADVNPSKISHCFFFYNSSTDAVRDFVPIVKDDIDCAFGEDEEQNFVRFFHSNKLKNLQENELNRLREVLKPSIHKREYGTEDKLNRQQKNLIEHKPNTWQMAQGVAGSGKTFTIAQRAANIASNGLRVLVVCFNKTLKDYIKIHLNNACCDFDWSLIDIFHFHGFVKEFVCENGRSVKEFANENSFIGEDFKEWENKILAIANNLLDNGYNTKQRLYDAILIDEAQDFQREWFDLLIRFLSENNEILLMADEKQNVYEKTLAWVKDIKGFKKQCVELKTSMRQKFFPEVLIKSSEFLDLYLKEYLEKNPDKTLGFMPLKLVDDKGMQHLRGFNEPYWQDVIGFDNCALINQIYKAYMFLLNKNIMDKDIAILLPNISLGNEVVNFFKNKRIEVEHTFGKNKKERDENKEYFRLQSNKLKISTIESFKGLEREAVIYVSDNLWNIKIDIESYIAFTRAISELIVFNQSEKYKAYGAKWYSFEAEISELDFDEIERNQSNARGKGRINDNDDLWSYCDG